VIVRQTKEIEMVDPIDWEALYGECRVYRSEAFGKSARRFEPPPVAVERLSDPTDNVVRTVASANVGLHQPAATRTQARHAAPARDRRW
jgi:hypothetical protein